MKESIRVAIGCFGTAILFMVFAFFWMNNVELVNSHVGKDGAFVLWIFIVLGGFTVPIVVGVILSDDHIEEKQKEKVEPINPKTFDYSKIGASSNQSQHFTSKELQE